ncbi:hypothetical protein IKB17_03750 [bacterium]|nr:hypothetical protein [bacterium]
MQDKNKILQESIGRVINKTRKQKGFKFTIFCYENDISKTTLHMIEKGKNKSYVTSLFEVIKALGLSFTEFGALLDKELPPEYWNNES